MNRYKVKHEVITASRCGAYVYHGMSIVEAETEEEAKRIEKERLPESYGFKKCRVKITNIRLVN